MFKYSSRSYQDLDLIYWSTSLDFWYVIGKGRSDRHRKSRSTAEQCLYITSLGVFICDVDRPDIWKRRIGVKRLISGFLRSSEMSCLGVLSAGSNWLLVFALPMHDIWYRKSLGLAYGQPHTTKEGW